MNSTTASALGMLLLLGAAACSGPPTFETDGGVGLPSVARSPIVGSADPRPAAPGLESMTYLERLPLLYPPGTQTKQFSSHDPRGGNYDGSFVRAFTKYQRVTQGTIEHVFFDEYGPGCLYRQQMNVWKFVSGNYPNIGTTKIRFYFDDETTPRIDKSINEFFGNLGDPPTRPPHALKFTDPAENFAVHYSPIPFAKRLIVALVTPTNWSARNTTWHQYTYLTYPQDQPVTSWSANAAGEQVVENMWAQLTNVLPPDPKPPSDIPALEETIALAPGVATEIFTHNTSQPSAIQSISLKVPECRLRDALFNTTLQIYWDGEPVAVDMLLGYFFGGGLLDGAANDGATVVQKRLKNLMYGYVSPASPSPNCSQNQITFYAYWPMPYWQSARMVLTNGSSSSWSVTRRIINANTTYQQGKAGYFRAKRTTDERPAQSLAKPAATTFQEEGRGHVVGISYYSDNFNMDGDEFTFIDKSRTPQIHGDGTEDDHNQGWGGSDFQKALWGGLINGFNGAYRLYLNDAYVFFDGIKINYEFSLDGAILSTKPQKTDVVFFYYKAPGSTILALTDTLDVGHQGSENAHQYSNNGTNRVEFRGAFSGYESDRSSDRFTDIGQEIDWSRFRVAINPGNRGVRLRKLLNRSGNGIQVATVRVDGVTLARPWSITGSAFAPASQAWLESDYDIPASVTQNKSSILVEISIVRATACKLSEHKYSVYSFMSE